MGQRRPASVPEKFPMFLLSVAHTLLHLPILLAVERYNNIAQGLDSALAGLSQILVFKVATLLPRPTKMG